jgi:hypothetical protein
MMIVALAMIYFYTLGAIYRMISEKKFPKTWVVAMMGILLSFVMGSFAKPMRDNFTTPHSWTAMQAVKSGDAAYYEQQYQERLAILEDPTVLDVVFEPYDVPESLMYFLYLGDIPSDETNQVNQRMAAIYGKNSIKILTSEGK